MRRLEWKRDTDTGAARRWNEDEDERGRWLRPAQLILTVTRRAAAIRGGRGGWGWRTPLYTRAAGSCMAYEYVCEGIIFDAALGTRVL